MASRRVPWEVGTQESRGLGFLARRLIRYPSGQMPGGAKRVHFVVIRAQGFLLFHPNPDPGPYQERTATLSHIGGGLCWSLWFFWSVVKLGPWPSEEKKVASALTLRSSSCRQEALRNCLASTTRADQQYPRNSFNTQLLFTYLLVFTLLISGGFFVTACASLTFTMHGI